jgi:hypothetical protein
VTKLYEVELMSGVKRETRMSQHSAFVIAFVASMHQARGSRQQKTRAVEVEWSAFVTHWSTS